MKNISPYSQHQSPANIFNRQVNWDYHKGELCGESHRLNSVTSLGLNISEKRGFPNAFLTLFRSLQDQVNDHGIFSDYGFPRKMSCTHL